MLCSNTEVLAYEAKKHQSRHYTQICHGSILTQMYCTYHHPILSTLKNTAQEKAPRFLQRRNSIPTLRISRPIWSRMKIGHL